MVLVCNFSLVSNVVFSFRRELTLSIFSIPPLPKNQSKSFYLKVYFEKASISSKLHQQFELDERQIDRAKESVNVVYVRVHWVGMLKLCLFVCVVVCENSISAQKHATKY